MSRERENMDESPEIPKYDLSKESQNVQDATNRLEEIVRSKNAPAPPPPTTPETPFQTPEPEQRRIPLIDLVEEPEHDPRIPSTFNLGIPQYLTIQKLTRQIEDNIRFYEAEGKFSDAVVKYIEDDIGRYQSSERYDRSEKAKLVHLVEARARISEAAGQLVVRGYARAAELVDGLRNEQLDALAEFMPEVTMAVNNLEGVRDDAEYEAKRARSDESRFDLGAYFRLSEADRNKKKDEIKLKIKDMRRQEYIGKGLIPSGVISPEDEEAINKILEDDANKAFEVAENLLKITGMAAMYAGPGETKNGRFVLKELEIMEDIDTHEGAGKTGEDKYFKNRAYWDKWRGWRINRLKQRGPSTLNDRKNDFQPDPAKPESPVGDLSRNMRWLMYLPEASDADPTTNAASLRYTMETYVRALPHWYGKKTLSEILKVKQVDDPRGLKDESGSVVKKPKLEQSLSSNFRWAGFVKNGAEVAKVLSDQFINKPLEGDDVGDLKNAKTTIANLDAVISKYKAMLDPVFKDLFSYATRNILVDTINYAKSNAPDRRKFFGKWSGLGMGLLNAMASYFSTSMTLEDSMVAKKALHADDYLIVSQDAGKTILKSFWEIFKAGSKGVTR